MKYLINWAKLHLTADEVNNFLLAADNDGRKDG
jgi:hypothetical protein